MDDCIDREKFDLLKLSIEVRDNFTQVGECCNTSKSLLTLHLLVSLLKVFFSGD